MNTIDYILKHCTICPRNCNADRSSEKKGYCKSNMSYAVSSIVVHKGEEPVIGGDKGICNIFFSRCNLQCIYCQNYQISCIKENIIESNYSFDEIIIKIKSILDTGVNTIGFVSPSHFTPHVKEIINALNKDNYFPVTVYNTNAYDKVETLKELEGLINIYLPDFKYMDAILSKNLSDSKDYPEIAAKAIKEMYRQKGSTLVKDQEGNAKSGLIIRHLVLPGYVDNSKKVLRYIADEISTNIHISLMSQYHPVKVIEGYPNLNRKLSVEEYYIVINEMEALGFYRGWVQDLESSNNYLPDFDKEHPFE